MSEEVQKHSIKYYGAEVDHLLRDLRKIVTLRKPNPKYDIAAGTPITAECPDVPAELPMVVIANDTRPLQEFPNPTLMLDGYGNAEIAAEDLKRFPTYEETTVESQMQRIAAIPEEVWQKLSEEEQLQILEKGLDLLLQDSAFRKIFFPSLLFWVADYGGSVEDWHAFLVRHGLVTEEEVKSTVSVDEETANFYLDTIYSIGLLNILAMETESPEYRSVVLFEQVSIPFN